MTVFWNGTGLILTGLMAVLVLRETRKEFAPYVLLSLCITVFFMSLPLLEEMGDWVQTVQINQPYAKVLLKAAGIAMLTETGCEICKAVGETGISGYAVWIGKTELLLITLPVFRELTELAIGFAG